MYWKFFFGCFGILLPYWPTLDELSTNVASANSRVLFTDELPTEGMEQDGFFTENSVEGFRKKTDQSSDLDQSPILTVKLFMCPQFLTILIKDSSLEGKANLKCSCTTCS